MWIFQSTRPIRGATGFQSPIYRWGLNFNPRAPYGARLARIFQGLTPENQFQSTRPIRGATLDLVDKPSGQRFQSTRPIRGATRRQGADRGHEKHFNPRAPYGARRVWYNRGKGRRYFNPRAPYGARLLTLGLSMEWVGISIHAPHTGRDS